MPRPLDIWLAAGVRTPFAKVDGALAGYDAIELSVPVARHMVDLLKGGKPDFVAGASSCPNLTFSNIAREVLMDAGIDATDPRLLDRHGRARTSMMGAFEAAGMIDGDARNLALVGGVDSLSRVQIGLGQRLSDWLRKFQQARSLGQKLDHVTHVQLEGHPAVHPADRQSHDRPQHGRAHRDHRQGMADQPRRSRTSRAESHRHAVAGWDNGFFDDLVIPFGDVKRDTVPRQDTSLEKLAQPAAVVRPEQRQGHTDRRQLLAVDRWGGGVWVASSKGLERLPATLPRVRLVDWELGVRRLPRRGSADGTGFRHPAAARAARVSPTAISVSGRFTRPSRRRCRST